MFRSIRWQVVILGTIACAFLGVLVDAIARHVLGWFRNWDDRLTVSFGAGLATLNLDATGKVVGICATLVAIACSVDRRLAQRRAEAEAQQARLQEHGERRKLGRRRRRGPDG